MKLQLGCGNQIFENYINVDFKRLNGVDVQADIRQLPFKDNSIEAIETYHTIEHIPRQEIESTLRDWFRVLKRDGELIIELPDFEQNCRDYLDAVAKEDWQKANMQLAFIYGGDSPAPEDAHRWGYSPLSLATFLYQVGFRNILSGEPWSYHTKQARCLAMKCRKR